VPSESSACRAALSLLAVLTIAVGFVAEHAGDGEWAVALRGATLHGPRARLMAGAGIVPGSDPDAEWAETEHKLGVYKKARLGNTFRWELEDRGYSKAFIETATEGLVVYLSRKG
jgi:hypothetical protein